MTSPTVSVVMSVFNNEDHVGKAIASILSQTFADFEFIVINDGSTDASGSIIDSCATADSRIRVIHQENTGLTRALIRGCQLARGEYIARQDADDYSEPQRLEQQVALLSNDGRVGFVSCWTRYIAPAGELLETHRRPADPITASHQLLFDRLGPPAHGSVLFRKDLFAAVGGYRWQFFLSQDSDLWLRLGERSLIGYVQHVGYIHRRRPNSLTGSSRDTQKKFGELAHACRAARLAGCSEGLALSRAAELCTSNMQDEQNRTKMGYLIGATLGQNGDRRALRYLWPVVCRRPWHWKAWLRLLQAALWSRNSAETIDG